MIASKRTCGDKDLENSARWLVDDMADATRIAEFHRRGGGRVILLADFLVAHW